MTNIASDDQRILEKDGFRLLWRHTVPVPIFVNISVVPLKPDAIIERVPRSHNSSIR